MKTSIIILLASAYLAAVAAAFVVPAPRVGTSSMRRSTMTMRARRDASSASRRDVTFRQASALLVPLVWGAAVTTKAANAAGSPKEALSRVLTVRDTTKQLEVCMQC